MEVQSTATRELMEKLVAQMDSRIASWKDDIVETIRLNRPPPPIIETAPGGSSVNGGGPVPSPGSRLDPNSLRRRPGKAPVEQMNPVRIEDNESVDMESGSEVELDEMNRGWALGRDQPPRQNNEHPFGLFLVDSNRRKVAATSFGLQRRCELRNQSVTRLNRWWLASSTVVVSSSVDGEQTGDGGAVDVG
nr:uncharacterized protein LOC109193863 [Ipomoea trifida]